MLLVFASFLLGILAPSWSATIVLTLPAVTVTVFVPKDILVSVSPVCIISEGVVIVPPTVKAPPTPTLPLARVNKVLSFSSKILAQTVMLMVI